MSALTDIAVSADTNPVPPVHGERKAFSVGSLDIVKVVLVS